VKPHDWGRYVRYADANDYLLLGWMPRSLAGTAHDRYALLMVWRCCCRDAPLEPRGSQSPARQHTPAT
jgi:hypothetical protein